MVVIYLELLIVGSGLLDWILSALFSAHKGSGSWGTVLLLPGGGGLAAKAANSSRDMAWSTAHCTA